MGFDSDLLDLALNIRQNQKGGFTLFQYGLADEHFCPLDFCVLANGVYGFSSLI